MRACDPVERGVALRDGVRVAYAVYGSGERTVLFFPAWSIVHCQMWKAQVPYFARRFRVVTFDGRGNGLSDKAPDLDYSDDAFAADALAVMDATGTSRAAAVALSAGCRWAVAAAARAPERFEGLICIGPGVPLGERNAARAAALARFESRRDAYDGWSKYNRHYFKSNYRDFLEFFFAEALCEPHSTKPFEDCVGWGLETSPETLAATVVAAQYSGDEFAAMLASVRCPITVLHGTQDRIVPFAVGAALAEATGGRLVTLAGSGHLPQARWPIRVNAEIRDAIEPAPKRRARRRRRKRALFLSSPIGLGHAQRDVAIADALRAQCSEVDVEWLAQHPVTELLRVRGERVHPASASLRSETAHFESECGEHDLHAFSAIRNMDEILTANFMVFYDLLRDERFDLVVGDEAWDVDHYLHENPREKRAAFVWMTDFVGWIPMPEGGEYERRITADYNAEMIEHVERLPGLRDRSIFVGELADVVPHKFGPDLPSIADWTAAHYEFPGYVTGFVPPSQEELLALRDEFGYRPDEAICIVTAGGSGVGRTLLQRIVAAYPAAKRRVPNLRMIVVTGPRIDPALFPATPGVEFHGYVAHLHRHLSVCDIALVQGGLTTTMELTAARRPFLYFPLRRHFEQNVHVRYRLGRYGAGRCMDFADADPERIAEAIEGELRATIDYLPVASDGAAKTASLISEVLA